MAEEKKETKNKVTKRSQNNPKAKTSTKRAPKNTVKETKKVEAKNTETNLKEVKKEVKKELKDELVKDVLKEINSEKKDAIKEVKEVSKEQVNKINDLKDDIKEEIKEVSKEVQEEPKELHDTKIKVQEVISEEAVRKEEVKPESVPVPAQPIPAQPVIEYESGYPESFFDGGVLGFIGWNLLNILLTLISLGILAPLGEILLLKWQYKHTIINGRRLTFDGGYFQLLGKMLLWILLSVITLGIYLFFVPVAWNKWVTKHLHYENNGGVVKESKFTGTTLGFIGVSICSLLLTVLSLGLLAPCAYAFAINWRISHTIIDGDELEFDGKALGIWGLCFKWLFFTIITLGIYSFWIPVSAFKWEVKHTNKRGISKKPYNPVFGVLIPLLVNLVIIGGIAFLFITGKVSYDKVLKIRQHEEKEEVKDVEYEWVNRYAKYLKYDVNDYKGVFIDFDDDKVPELVLKQEVAYCLNCDANKDIITILYIKNDKVRQSNEFDNAYLVNLYNMANKDNEWYVRKKDTYTNVLSILKDNLESFSVDTEVLKNDFDNNYFNMDEDINYESIDRDDIKDALKDLAKNYTDNKSYQLISDKEVDSKIKEYEAKQDEMAKANLTEANYKEKVDTHIKWFTAAFLGSTYGWPDIYEYKQVDVKLPNYNNGEMVYELVGLKSIEELKNKLALYVDKDKFNLFNHNDVAYGLTDYNGKVYWASLGVGDGPYLKDYSLVSSENGIAKVRLNIYNYITNSLQEYVIVTIKYQASTKSYLITDWETHLT